MESEHDQTVESTCQKQTHLPKFMEITETSSKSVIDEFLPAQKGVGTEEKHLLVEEAASAAELAHESDASKHRRNNIEKGLHLLAIQNHKEKTGNVEHLKSHGSFIREAKEAKEAIKNFRDPREKKREEEEQRRKEYEEKKKEKERLAAENAAAAKREREEARAREIAEREEAERLHIQQQEEEERKRATDRLQQNFARSPLDLMKNTNRHRRNPSIGAQNCEN